VGLNIYALSVSNVIRLLLRKNGMQLNKYQYFHEFQDDIVILSMKQIIKGEKASKQFRDKDLENAAKTILEYFT
jgi:hypothetical protein